MFLQLYDIIVIAMSKEHKTSLTLSIKMHLYDVQQEFQIERDKIIYLDIDSRVRDIIKEKKIPKENFILYTIQANNKQIRMQSHRDFVENISIVVYFEDQYQIMKERLNAISEEYNRMEKYFFRNDIPQIPCFSLAPLILKSSYLSKYEKKSMLDPAIDIAFIFASPFVKMVNGEVVSTKFIEVNHMADISKIKKKLEKNQDIIQLSIQQGTKQELMTTMQHRTRILHIYCNVQEINSEVFLCLEDKQNIGMQQNFSVSQFSKIAELTRPDLIILVGYQVYKAAKEIFDLNYNAVISIDTVNYNEDVRAHTFVEKLYQCLSKGLHLEECFDKVKIQAQRADGLDQLNCCCYHPHKPECLWNDEAKKFGIEACHKIYHVYYQQCNCQKQKQFIAKAGNIFSCPFGRKKFKKNPIYSQVFDFKQEFPRTNFFCDNFCCCYSSEERQEVHSNVSKFNYYKKNGLSNIFKATQGAVITQFIPHMSREKNYEYENMYGVNKHMYQLIQGIKDWKFGLNIHGSKRSGRTTLLKQATRYLLDRNFSQYLKFQCNFVNIQSFSDCEYIFKEAMGVSKTQTLAQAFNELKDQKVIFILDNCDYLDKHLRINFSQMIKMISDSIPHGLQVIAISEERLSDQIFGNRFWQIPPIEPNEAAHIFLRTSPKITINDVDLSLVSSQFRRFEQSNQQQKNLQQKNLLVYQKIDSIKQQYAAINSRSLSQIISKNIARATDDQKQQSQAFAQIISTLKMSTNAKECQIYNFLIFLYQFQEGLTELDFGIISKLNSFNNKVSKDYLRINWKYITDFVNCNNQQSPLEQMQMYKQPQQSQKQKIDSTNLNNYTQIILNKGYYYKQIRLNDDSRRFLQKNQQQKLNQMRLRSLRYLTIYTVAMIKYLTRNYHYHESIYQFSNISETGIFEIKKMQSYKQFFDESSFFPFQQDLESVDEALQFLTEVCTTRHNDEIVEIRSITKLINQQKQNITSTYRINLDSLCFQDQNMKNIFQHYYYVLLVNIATICITLTSQIGPLFIESCISKSIQNSCFLKNKKKTYGMLRIKLYIIKLGVDLKQATNKIQLLEQFEKTTNQIVKQSWQSKQDINIIWEIELQFIRLYFHLYLINIKGQGGTILKMLNKLSSLIDLVTDRKTSKSKQIKGFKTSKLLARLSILKTEYILRYTSITDYSQVFPSLYQEINEAIRLYQNFSPKSFRLYGQKEGSNTEKIQLNIKIQLNDIECKLRNPNSLFSDFQQCSIQFKKKITDKIQNQKLYKISSKEILKQQMDVAENLKIGLWKRTDNVMIYMRSSPFQNSDDSNKNMIRNYSKFKEELQKMLHSSCKNVMTIFRLLTSQNLKMSLSHGCLLLVLTIDCEIDQQNNLFLIFQHDKLPIQDKKPVSQFVQILNNSQVGILLICGKYSLKLSKYLKSYNIDRCPLLIAIDTLAAEDTIKSQPSMSIGKHLQRIVLDKSIQFFIRKFSEKIVNTKINKQDFNNQMKIIKKSTYSSMRAYIAHGYDYMRQFDQLRDILNPWICQTLRERQIEFQDGQYKDITFESRSHNNIQNSYDNVGRLQDIVQVSKLLIKPPKKQTELTSSNQSVNSYLNIYGVSGIGKKTLMIQVAFPFIARKIFEDGIYMIDCEKVDKNFRGHIMEYLQQQLNVLLQKLNTFSNRKSDISLLMILDNFTQIDETENENFFRLVQELNVKLVIITIRKYHKKKIFNTELISYELNQFSEQEARIFVYSILDLNYYAKNGDIQTIGTVLNITHNKSYIPAQMKKQIDKFSEDHKGHIRKKQKDRETDISEGILTGSLMGSGMLFASNTMDNVLFTSQTSFIPTNKNKLTKVRIVSKKRFDFTPDVSQVDQNSRSRKASNVQQFVQNTR